MNLVEEAVDVVRANWDGGDYSTPALEEYKSGALRNAFRLRLDSEFSFDAVEELGDEKTLGLLLDLLETDLEDLVENGDVTHASDPLLKSIDGSQKRGTPLKSVEILSLRLFKERNEARKSMEYTMFVTINTEW